MWTIRVELTKNLLATVRIVRTNKPGTAQVGTIFEAQKNENHFFYNSRQRKLSKNDSFRNYLKFPVSRIVPKNEKGGTLWNFLNIHFVANDQKLMGGTISVTAEKRRKVP